ncbi:penicillin acylase family protein [Adhaeribacter rhizoryzae]|uniref:Penicillin acylase family protein n=1 Tax=Adhaeribacter rhizoryzae TaxID=2607907 RepID=A0A5M6CYY8_9BACT|nr:penicillin acylase family protein [Adhaeribacter rhizoryzae]KAA5540333.1 penicillin acylase family protein [Adhaeribacter rhizoryzae]
MKWLRAILSLIILLALVYALNTKFGDVPPVGKFLSPFTGFWQQAESKDLAAEEELTLPGIQDNVTILFDKSRIPHVFAQNDQDLYFAQGYLTARDRLWQMEFQTHAAAGRISEIIGSKAIDFDRFQRRMGMVYGAQQSLAGMMAEPTTRTMLQSYTAGVNAYIAQLSPKTYPLEYKLLDYAPEPWTPLKCALLLKVMAYDLAGRSNDLRMINILRKYGPEVVKDLFPNYPFREDPIVPVGTELDFKPLNIPAAPENFMAEFSNKVLEKEPPAELGSNNWAVAGNKTTTGFPMLANDPHLQLNLPSIWYQVQLVAPGVNVYGVSIPGAPGIIIGFNKEVSWGVTNVDADVMDWYQIKFKDATKKEYFHDNQWKPVRQVIEKIKIRGGAIRNDTVYYTHHGPVVYDRPEEVFNKQTPVSHAMRWIAHDKSNELRTLYLLNRAHNYQDFQEALQYWVAPAQNFVYADVHQDIALWPNGKFPLKWKTQGKFTLDGSNKTHDWQGWIPAAQNPHVKNPARGFVSSANQFSAGPDYPYYINWEFAPADRGIRINQRLAAMQKISPDSMRGLQNDNFNINAQTVLPTLLAQLDKNKLNQTQQQAFLELSKWQYYNHPDQLSPTIFEVWWQALSKAIWDDEFGSKTGLEMRYPNRDRTWHLVLQEPQAKWYDNIHTPAKETLPMLAQQTFVATIDSLAKQHGALGKKWQWANHKATSVQHLAKLPGFGHENIFVGGGRNIVNATSERNGPSWRMVVALGPQVKGYGIYPGGQSGNPGSFYYDNLLETWRQGKLNELVYLQSPTDGNAQFVSKLSLRKK